MHVGKAEVLSSPDRADHVRLSARVDYESRPGAEDYWFEVHRSHIASLSDSGHPWVVALLPLAATLSEPLRVGSPIDARLATGASELLRIWKAWYPELATPRIEAPLRTDRPASSGARSAAFFSGGVDSSFTATRPRKHPVPGKGGDVDDLITIGGFDVSLGRSAALDRIRRKSETTAEELGKGFLEVRTNLRDTVWSEADWGSVAHGCALGAVGLALERRYRSIYVAATGGYRDLHPWGSHPLTDRLMSTASTHFIHDGAAHTRVEKIRHLLEFPVVLDNLRVCFQSGTGENCGRCLKCVRTMLALELLGGLHRCGSFTVDEVPSGRLRELVCTRSWHFREFRDLHDLAIEVGREDLKLAIERLLCRSRRRGASERRRKAMVRAARGLKHRIWKGWEAVRGILRKALPALQEEP